jgi:hypothetical protein
VAAGEERGVTATADLTVGVRVAAIVRGAVAKCFVVAIRPGREGHHSPRTYQWSAEAEIDVRPDDDYGRFDANLLKPPTTIVLDNEGTLWARGWDDETLAALGAAYRLASST